MKLTINKNKKNQDVFYAVLENKKVVIKDEQLLVTATLAQAKFLKNESGDEILKVTINTIKRK